MKYDAFISYRHSELDMFVAKNLHKSLETFKVPKAIRKKSGKKSIKRVFRDQEELPIGSDLGDNISHALEESEYLLVICSPRTPESYWVKKEINSFMEMHGRDHVLAVLIEGEPNESFPPELLTDENGNPVEPLAADVRGQSKSEVLKKMKTEVMRLASVLLYCSYDDLKQRHRERRLKKMFAIGTAITSVAAVLGIAFGIYNARTAKIIQENYTGKQINQSKYLADTSKNLLKTGDRRAAILVALEALPSKDNDRPYVAEAEQALTNALYAYDAGVYIDKDSVLRHNYPVDSMKFGREGKYLASSDEGDNLYVWNVEDSSLRFCIPSRTMESGYSSQIEGIDIIGDEVYVSDRISTRAFNMDGELVWEMKPEFEISNMSSSADKGIIVVYDPSHIEAYDVTNKSKLLSVTTNFDNSYTSGAVIAESGKGIYIPLLSKETQQGAISYLDFESRKETIYFTTHNNICCITETPNGNLAAVSIEFDTLFEGGKDENFVVDYIDTKSNTIKWTQILNSKSRINIQRAYSSMIKARNYTDSDGTAHDEVIASCATLIKTMDAKSGEIVSEMDFTDCVAEFAISRGSSIGYVADQEGAFYFADITTGRVIDDATVKTESYALKMAIGGQTVAMGGADENIRLLKYHNGFGKEDMLTLSTSSYKRAVSADGKYISLSSLTGMSTAEDVIDVDTNEIVYSTLIDSMVADQIFIDEKNFVVFGTDAVVRYADVSTGEETVVEPTGSMVAAKASLSADRKYAIVYHYDTIYLLDVNKRQYVDSATLDEDIWYAQIGNSGKIYGVSENRKPFIYDMNNKSVHYFEDEKLMVCADIYDEEPVEVNADESRMIVACEDNMLRIINLSNDEILNEIPLYAKNKLFMMFGGDGDLVYLQGDNQLFEVYSMSAGDTVYVSNEAKSIIYSGEEHGDELILDTGLSIIVFDLKGKAIKNEIWDATVYNPMKNMIILETGKELYKFRIASLSDLIAEAEKWKSIEPLTEREKVTYHIE